METMLDLEPKTIAGLQSLIGVNVDSAKGFKLAAESATNPALATLFSDLASERARFAAELQVHVAWSDEEPRDDGSLRGKLHRRWIELRSALTRGDSYALLAECERGEDAILEQYKQTIVETTGNPLNGVLHEQVRSIKAAHDRVRDLRDTMGALRDADDA